MKLSPSRFLCVVLVGALTALTGACASDAEGSDTAGDEVITGGIVIEKPDPASGKKFTHFHCSQGYQLTEVSVYMLDDDELNVVGYGAQTFGTGKLQDGTATITSKKGRVSAIVTRGEVKAITFDEKMLERRSGTATFAIERDGKTSTVDFDCNVNNCSCRDLVSMARSLCYDVCYGIKMF